MLLAMWDIFLHENNCNYNSYNLVKNSLLSPFCTFFEFKNKIQIFKVGGLVKTNISAFCLKRVALYFKAMPNSIYFYKGIFLHVIPVR